MCYYNITILLKQKKKKDFKGLLKIWKQMTMRELERAATAFKGSKRKAKSPTAERIIAAYLVRFLKDHLEKSYLFKFYLFQIYSFFL